MKLNNVTINVLVGLASAVAGSAATYFVVNKAAQAKWHAIAEEEIESVKKTYQLFKKEGPFATPEGARKEILERLDEYQEMVRDYDASQEPEYNVEADKEWEERDRQELEAAAEGLPEGEPEEDEADPELKYHTPVKKQEDVKFHNVFEDQEVDPVRDPNNPYIIPEAEFLENYDDFSQEWLTFYEGDQTVADEQNKIVRGIATVLGTANLGIFEQTGAKRVDILHIRNDKLKCLYEVARDEGSFAEKVLGINSNAPVPRNERND